VAFEGKEPEEEEGGNGEEEEEEEEVKASLRSRFLCLRKTGLNLEEGGAAEERMSVSICKVLGEGSRQILRPIPR
jgi:hypothetical protein